MTLEAERREWHNHASMRTEKTRLPTLTPRRLSFGVVALCAAAWLPAVSQAAGPLADTGTRLAYVDPGSGSFILQALVATLAGAAVAINAYWAKIKRFFGRGTPEEDDDARGNKPGDD
jgi:hypothetical protein